MVEFGEKLKQIREERGLTQQTLAEKLYVTRQAVSRWECGARYPDLLTARITGVIMCVLYALTALSFLFTFVDMQIKSNGYLNILSWITEFAVPLAFAAGIVLFFGWKERRIPLLVIWGICLLTVGYLAYVYRLWFMRFTDLGFVVTTVHMVGKMGMAALLAYQAYVWDKKRKLAYESVEK